MKLRLDQKYFIPFIGVSAIVFLGIIAIYSIEYAKHQRTTFQKMVNLPGVFDSVRVTPLGGGEPFLLKDSLGGNKVLVFWAAWSEQSELFLRGVCAEAAKAPSQVTVIGLMVKDQPQDERYVQSLCPNAVHVKGTSLYSGLKAVGVPSVIAIDSLGNVRQTGIGSKTDIQTLVRF